MRCADLLRGKNERADLIDDAEDPVPERVICGGSIESFLFELSGLVGMLLLLVELLRR